MTIGFVEMALARKQKQDFQFTFKGIRNNIQLKLLRNSSYDCLCTIQVKQFIRHVQTVMHVSHAVKCAGIRLHENVI